MSTACRLTPLLTEYPSNRTCDWFTDLITVTGTSTGGFNSWYDGVDERISDGICKHEIKNCFAQHPRFSHKHVWANDIAMKCSDVQHLKDWFLGQIFSPMLQLLSLQGTAFRAAWKLEANEEMARRWVASSFLSVEKGFRMIMGYKDLWMLKAAPKENVDKGQKAA